MQAIKNIIKFGSTVVLKGTHGRILLSAGTLPVKSILLVASALLFAGALPAFAEYPASSEKGSNKDRVLSQAKLELPFKYVESAQISHEVQFGHPTKSLIIRFKNQQAVLSSLFGWQDGITTVGNHYITPQGWDSLSDRNIKGINRNTMALLDLDPNDSSFLYTGADVENYAYIELETEEQSKIIQVGVFATAGVKTNALRAGFDASSFWEPGTINLIILANRNLSSAAMTQIIITATEAKTAALEDLDIRSSYSFLPATGTGTDNIIVVGDSSRLAEVSTMAGGHTKLGELIGKATYLAVTEAIALQNGLTSDRPVEARLKEYGIDLEILLRHNLDLSIQQKELLLVQLSELLKDPYYAGFIASALTLSDSVARGLVMDTFAFQDWSARVARKLAKKQIEIKTIVSIPKNYTSSDNNSGNDPDSKASPIPIEYALNCVLSGLLKDVENVENVEKQDS